MIAIKPLAFAVLAACAWNLPMSAQASVTDAVPSCYDRKIPNPAPQPVKELFVAVDQTTLLDAGLKQSVAEQVRPFLAPGHRVSVLVFSAYTQGRYTQLLTSVQLDSPLPVEARNDISKPSLSQLDQCLTRQSGLAAQAVGAAMRQAFAQSSADIANSDVMGSLKDIATKVRQSAAAERVVLVVSDMLENSSVSSFYVNQAVRKLDPVHELQIATQQQMLGDFGGGRVYVLGAGLLNLTGNNTKAAYRDPKTMQGLAAFWRLWFEKSNGQLKDFGQPALLNPIR